MIESRQNCLKTPGPKTRAAKVQFLLQSSPQPPICHNCGLYFNVVSLTNTGWWLKAIPSLADKGPRPDWGVRPRAYDTSKCIKGHSPAQSELWPLWHGQTVLERLVTRCNCQNGARTLQKSQLINQLSQVLAKKRLKPPIKIQMYNSPICHQ